MEYIGYALLAFAAYYALVFIIGAVSLSLALVFMWRIIKRSK